MNLFTGMIVKVQGGGNTGNALTCAARLGLKPRLISKVLNIGFSICFVDFLSRNFIPLNIDEYEHPEFWLGLSILDICLLLQLVLQMCT